MADQTWQDKFDKLNKSDSNQNQSQENPIVSGAKSLGNFLFGNTLALPGKINDLSKDQASRQPIQGSMTDPSTWLQAGERALSDTGKLIGATAPAAAEVYTATELPGAVKTIAKATPDLLGYLTRGGVGKKIGAAYEKATASGVTDSAGDVVKEIRQGVSQKLGNDPKYADIVNRRIASDIIGPSVEENPSISPSKLFELKQQASNRLPNGFLSKFQGKNATNQVDEVIRDIVGKRAVDITPGVDKLNKIYQLYSSPIGSPAAAGAKLAGGALVSQYLPKPLKDLIGF